MGRVGEKKKEGQKFETTIRWGEMVNGQLFTWVRKFQTRQKNQGAFTMWIIEIHKTEWADQKNEYK